MKLLVCLFICNSIILFAQPDSTWEDFGCFPQIDTLPKIIGGIESIQHRLIYPPNALERKMEGMVIIFITIDSLGNPNNPRIMKSIGMGRDEEAVRLVKTAKFSPAYFNGKYINIDYSIPIKFRLPKKE